MSQQFTESVVEQAALAWLETLGYDAQTGPQISPGGVAAPRDALRPRIISGELRVPDAERIVGRMA